MAGHGTKTAALADKPPCVTTRHPGGDGGIAPYKSAELLRRLTERGAQVQVVMTAAARDSSRR